MSYILLRKVILPTAVILASPVILLTTLAVAVKNIMIALSESGE